MKFLDLVGDPVFRKFCRACTLANDIDDVYKPRVMAVTYYDVDADPTLTAGPHIYRYPSGFVAVPGNLVSVVIGGEVKYSKYPPDIDFAELGERPELEMLYGPRRYKLTPAELLLFHAYTSFFVSLYLSVANSIDLAPVGELVFYGNDGEALRVTTFVQTSQLVTPHHYDTRLAYSGAARLYDEAMFSSENLSLARAVNLATALALARARVSGLTRLFCPKEVKKWIDDVLEGKWIHEETELGVREAPFDIPCARRLEEKGITRVKAEIIGASIVIRKGDDTCPLRGSLEAGWHYVAPLTSLC